MITIFLELLATFCAGVFFGAAVYISIVQHPAALNAGGGVPGRFFAPMYRRAAPMQASLALIGSVAGSIAWFTGSGWPWLVGGLLLFAVVPFTFLRMMSVNNKLKEPGRDPEASETLALLHQWGRLHMVRSVLSALAFVTFLLQLAVQ